MKYLILFLFIAGISGCSSKKGEQKVEEGTIPVINLSENVQDVKSLPLSDVAAKVEIVPLETTENSLMAEVTMLQTDAHNIWVKHFRDKSLLRFSRQGKFLNKIGRVGNGPGEFSCFTDFMLDGSQQEVYVVTCSNGVYVYDFTGFFKRKIADYQTLSEHTRMTANLKYYRAQSHFVATAALPVFYLNNKDSLWSFASLDSCFRIKTIYKNPAYSGWEDKILQGRVNMMRMDEYWTESPVSVDTDNGQMTVKFSDTDTIYIYNASNETLTPWYAISSKEEKGDYERTHRRFKERSDFDYLSVKAHYLTKDYIYLFGSKGEGTYLYCYDKHSGKVRLLKGKGRITERVIPVGNNPVYRRFEGNCILTNDICGGQFSIDYTSDGKYWVDILQPGDEIDIETIKAAPVKDERLRALYIDAINKLMNDENSNPLLIVVTLK